MPINPREFERLVTHHFATVTDEEFLANLRKSSPYLFTDSSEKTNDLQISCISDLNSNIPVDRINPTPKFNSPRVPGQDKGSVAMSADFNDPLPGDILDEFYKD